jgi:D-3-phosphoglycerate dehydrogenase / 2-oxoglutarate reductase
MKVLISDPVDAKAVQTMRDAGLEVDVRDDITPDDLLTAIPQYDAIVVRSRTKATAAVIDAGKNLKVIVRGGVGVDNIDVAHAKEKGVKVMNTPAASSISVAELTIGYMFAMARQIPQMTASMKAVKWEKKKFEGSEVCCKTLGLIGAGRIGHEVAKRAKGLGMDVVIYDPYLSQEAADELGVKCVSLAEVLANADYISIHTPLTDETRNMINTQSIAKMKDGVRIINCARGGIIDENALVEALQTGKVAGAALDVYAEEPLKDPKLYEQPNVIGSPHVGAATVEAQDRIGSEVAKILIDFAKS